MRTSLIVIFTLCAVLTSGGCAVGKLYLLPKPTKSAKIIQTWRVEEFVAMVEAQLKEVDRIASSPDDNHLKLPPVFPVPFDFASLPDLKKVARAGDRVVWFQDMAWGHHIEYVCVEREGTIIWTRKKIWSEADSLANQALQHNDPSCHVSCLRTPRASRGRG